MGPDSYLANKCSLLNNREPRTDKRISDLSINKMDWGNISQSSIYMIGINKAINAQL
jgi:hypothetical protein